MHNLNSDNRDVYFIDLDGTVIRHNYDPDDIEELALSGTIEFLNSIDDQFIIFVTSREKEHAEKAVDFLRKKGFNPDYYIPILYKVPTGRRIVINDYVELDKPKAIAYNIPRNSGLIQYVKNKDFSDK